jgi:hypothetical protein
MVSRHHFAGVSMESLYQHVARTGGIPTVRGPERRSWLRLAAVDAYKAAAPKLDDERRRLLSFSLLDPKDCFSRDRDRRLAIAIQLWCEARWDGAAPVPRRQEAARLLEDIAGNTLSAPPSRHFQWRWVIAAACLCVTTAGAGKM